MELRRQVALPQPLPPAQAPNPPAPLPSCSLELRTKPTTACRHGQRRGGGHQHSEQAFNVPRGPSTALAWCNRISAGYGGYGAPPSP